MRTPLVLLVLLASLTLSSIAGHAAPVNLCPNPGAEEGAAGQPAGWYVEGGTGVWDAAAARTGGHALKLVSKTPGLTLGWNSPMIPVPPEGGQLLLTVWAKMDRVTGKNGAFVGFYHTDAKGERIGQSGGVTLGGVGDEVASTDWLSYTALSQLTPEVKGVRVNLRLYGATGTIWFDDVMVQVQNVRPLTAPRALRHGLRVGTPGGAALVAPRGTEALVEELQRALHDRGYEVPVAAAGQVDLATEKRDLLVLGNLANNPAAGVPLPALLHARGPQLPRAGRGTCYGPWWTRWARGATCWWWGPRTRPGCRRGCGR